MNQPDSARIEYEKLAKAIGKESYRPDPVTPGKGELVLFIARGVYQPRSLLMLYCPPLSGYLCQGMKRALHIRQWI
jgi:hypothetical protein